VDRGGRFVPRPLTSKYEDGRADARSRPHDPGEVRDHVDVT
jgi:hypothetical protein